MKKIKVLSIISVMLMCIVLAPTQKEINKKQIKNEGKEESKGRELYMANPDDSYVAHVTPLEISSSSDDSEEETKEEITKETTIEEETEEVAEAVKESNILNTAYAETSINTSEKEIPQLDYSKEELTKEELKKINKIIKRKAKNTDKVDRSTKTVKMEKTEDGGLITTTLYQNDIGTVIIKQYSKEEEPCTVSEEEKAEKLKMVQEYLETLNGSEEDTEIPTEEIQPETQVIEQETFLDEPIAIIEEN